MDTWADTMDRAKHKTLQTLEEEKNQKNEWKCKINGTWNQEIATIPSRANA